MGSGTWTFNATGNNATNFTGCVVSAQTSTLKLVGGFNNTRTLTAAGNTFNTLQLHAGNIGTIAIADAVTAETLVLSGTTNSIDYGVRAAAAGTTITVNGDLNISGNGLSRGTYNVAGDLNLSGGMIDGGTLNLAGDLNVTSGSTSNGSGRIVWNKAGNETWSPAGKMCNLTVNTARTITMASTLNAIRPCSNNRIRRYPGDL